MSTPTLNPSGGITADRLRRGAGFGGSVSLVAEREIRMRLRSKSLIISTSITLALIVIGIVASSVLPGVIAGSSGDGDARPVAVVAGVDALPAGTAGLLDETPVADHAEGERLLRDGEVDAVLVPSDAAAGFEVIALDEVPGGLVTDLTIAPEVTLLDPQVDQGIAYFVAFGFGIVFFMSGILFGTQIAQSVIEEKQTRIVEILMSSVSVRALLAGKVIGNSILAFGQLVLFAAVGGITLALTGQGAILAMIGPSVLWFLLFFVVGFVLLASLYAATGALVSRQEDLSAATNPVMMLVMVPYFAIVFFYSIPAVVAVLSYLPFSAAVGMPMRIFLGDVMWWEPVLSLVISVGATIGVVLLAARMYENSLLRTGARVTWAEALKREKA